MKNKIINFLIRECSIDPRVKNGMFNPFVQEHMEVLKEFLMVKEFEYETIKEFTNKIIEGRFPERQAYNKEGFLVTFPTPDYKAKALTSGDYYNYDPTHGKGGMHLVKKASPDKIRSTSDIQDTPIEIKPPENIESPVATPPRKSETPPIQVDIKPPRTQEPQDTAHTQRKIEPPKTKPDVTQQIDIPPPASAETERSLPDIANTKDTAAPEQPQASSQKKSEPVEYMTSTPEGTPLDLTDFSAYKDPSLEWAHNQKWEKRDNGNYYDANGNLRAVVGLDGAAVPATENDRASLRQWIDRKRKERLPGEKS
jgi:hypothetical protein